MVGGMTTATVEREYRPGPTTAVLHFALDLDGPGDLAPGAAIEIESRAAAPTSRQTTRRAFPSSKPGVSQSSEPVKLSRVSLPSLLGRRAGVVEKGNRWEQGDQNFCPSFWTDFMCMA
jgi:hypothetical protein